VRKGRKRKGNGEKILENRSSLGIKEKKVGKRIYLLRTANKRRRVKTTIRLTEG